jgi:hypothetical protein
MTTDVRKRRGTWTAWSEPVRRTLFSRAIGLLIYAAVLGAIAAVVAYAVQYNPFSTHNFAAATAATDAGHNLVQVSYSDGDTFSFGFLLANNGPVPLTIQKIQLTGARELLVPVNTQVAPKRAAGHMDDPSLRTFLQFSFEPGGQRWVVVRTRFANCERFHVGAFETYTQFQVTYKEFGFTRHAWVKLPKSIRVDSPPDEACPARSA